MAPERLLDSSYLSLLAVNGARKSGGSEPIL